MTVVSANNNDEGRQVLEVEENYVGPFPSVHTNFINALSNDADPIAPAEAGLAALEATLSA